ncbi:MAG: GxxExxY protein [Planctomycetaceae bacterium]|jgi:GxxExxY protein|nr:GxxExxY protein [Planctomycetaceae bacterium]
MLHQDLTEKIIGCAFQVSKQLGFGYQESVYQKSMLIELTKRGLNAQMEVPITVYYDDQPVGDFFADLVVENTIIIELKSIQQLAVIHEVQLVNYLVATKTDVGLLINFGPKNIDIKRKTRLLGQDGNKIE